MSRFRLSVSLAIALASASGAAPAQDFLVRHAKVHTADARGTIADGDVRVRGGRIAEIGNGLAPGAGETVVEAKGRPLTPGFFAGGTEIGVEEVSQEATTVDKGYAPAKRVPADERESIRQRLGGLDDLPLRAAGVGDHGRARDVVRHPRNLMTFLPM